MGRPGEDLERLVEKIQRQLAPQAEVIHNAKLMGRNSGVERQIDVLVRDYIGQYEINIAIECKDYKRPVDVKAVESFSGMLADINAQKGVLVCRSGFTSGAASLAGSLKIDLYSPVDIDIERFEIDASMPIIFEIRESSISFELSARASGRARIPNDFYETCVVLDADGNELGIPSRVAVDKWNSGNLPNDVGLHGDLPLFDAPKLRMDNGFGELMEVEISISLWVEHKLFFGYAPITKMLGFHDHLKDMTVTNAFEIGVASFEEIEGTWLEVEGVENCPLRPVLHLIGFYGYADP